ncbi:hypothetical protein ACQ4M4_09000 [Leptolyngbya sp. AN02str]
MPPQDMLALAQQGDPTVLTSIFNHAFKPMGIEARVANRSQALHVVLRAAHIPDQARAIALVQRLVTELSIQAVDMLQLYAHQIGAKQLAWQHTFTLRPTGSSSQIWLDAQPHLQRGEDTAPGTIEAIAPNEADPIPDFENPFEHPPILDTMSPNEWFEQPQAQPSNELPFKEVEPLNLLPEQPLATPKPALDLATPPEEDWLKRPESAILIIFVILVAIWEFYLELVEGDGSLSSVGLAKRLGVSRSTVSRRKRDSDFSAWSQSLDPDGIAWSYRTGRFLPQW